ncbi:MAG: hypothetical protein ACI865_002476 [Flavobacteriaceae bacterium]|jgi:hypothetical protein
MWNASAGYTQESALKDTLYMNDDGMETPVFYGARDSIYTDLIAKQLHLYGEARVDNGEINMTAGYIMIDMNTNELLARHAYDKDSNKIELPEFTNGGDVMTAHAIRYNFNSEKGYIEEVAIQQDENFLHMKVAKRHANEQVHFREGRFTTCELDEPHYHFQLSKAVMIPDKRIVSGPMNLWIGGVPTPLGLPFAVIPQSEDRAKGFLFPNFAPVSQYGFGIQNLGYYIPINPFLQTTFYGSLYSRGSWELSNSTEYAKRYGYTGNFSLGYQQLKNGFPTNTRENKTSVRWTHRKDPKSSPYWGFAANVNFISDNTTQNNLDPEYEEYFDNSFNSDISLNRNFPGKPITAGMKLSLRQNTISQNISLTSPVVNVNVTRFFPFKKYFNGTKGWHDLFTRFGLTYNFEGKNQALFVDTLLRDKNYGEIGTNFFNGMQQNMTAQTTASLFGDRFKLTPSVNYGTNVNFQQVKKFYDTTYTSNVRTDTSRTAGIAQTLSFNAQLTTVVYTYYRFIGKNQPLLRHVLTPSFGYSFRPNLNENSFYFVDAADTIGTSYSPYERSLYPISSTRNQSLFTFSFNNTFELKRKSAKDTVDGFKRTRIIDALSISGNYDFADGVDSMRLSNIAVNMRISPVKWLSIVTTSRFSPYGWHETTGATLGEYAVVENGKLGRFLSTNLATGVTFTSKESRKVLKKGVSAVEESWNDDYAYFNLHPEHALNFNIPWKLTLSHIYAINANQARSTTLPDAWNFDQTMMLNGDVSFTKRWKLATTTNLNLETLDITNARFILTRDMHCWALNFQWTPIGGNKSFLFSIRSTSKLFQDAKIDIRKPPAFL